MSILQPILKPIIDDIHRGRKTIDIGELSGATKTLLVFGLWREIQRPLLVVTATEKEAESLLEDLRFFSSNRHLLAINDGNDGAFRSKQPVSPAAHQGMPSDGDETFFFPAWGVLPFEADSPDSRTTGERMRFLYHLLSGNPGMFVTSINALMQKLPPRDRFLSAVHKITPGMLIDPHELVTILEALGYESSSLVTRTGEFSRRGGIVDLFSPYHAAPVRLEFFGDTIDSLRSFDPESQRSIGSARDALVLPVRELIITDEDAEYSEKKMDRSSKEPGSAHGEAAEPSWQHIAGDIRLGMPPPGAEFLAPFFYTMESLFHYAPDTSILAFVEPDTIKKTADTYWDNITRGRQEETNDGRTLPAPDEMYLPFEEIGKGSEPFPTLSLHLLGSAANRRGMNTQSAAALGIRLTKSLGRELKEGHTREGTIAGLVEKLQEWKETNRISIVCSSEQSGTRLTRMFSEYGLALALGPELNRQETGPWPVMLVTGRLSSGFSWPELGRIVITEEEIFGEKVHRPRPSPSTSAPFLSSFKELKIGNFVVHTDYGVGEYRGLTHLSVDGFATDYLTLRYEPDAKLYVPLYSLEKVQKYLGIEGSAPRLDRLGAPAWTKTKEKIKKDILEIARGLVAVFAARASHSRTPFSPPDNQYREFEASFPYEETPDQQRAIEDILADMQKQHPMDRLVCGDVGYGKTEVALRAAFKAVEDGMQVAVLVPTTLLADQHFRTFTERLDPFAVTVAMLSRFRTRAEQTKTLKRLKTGTLDIVIATHRLLQKDVSFKNLGLLVVDEEHRFGVRHKERVKEFKKLVDVLTLTATPIPRTLHMSLAGIRDLSIIQTPPLDRQAVHVVVARFGKRVIREAIMQELARNGQVFFVHNRVQGIQRIAEFIQSLVPESVIGVAHGQMKDDEIEAVMAAFISGKLNVLVTTTIIESGIDIPSANTMIINRADRFGLAELYQIKGRVGRSRLKAYAYLLTPAEEALSESARKRLRAIQELSELGAGFRIAAQDLETRGAGNILGKQQSGHIAAVGIDLYTQMMDEAMAELRGEETRTEPDTIINMRASAFIPEDYIEDMGLRLAAYKELSSAESEADLADLADGLQDRYGKLPEPAKNLLDIMGLKLAAKRSMVARVDAGTRSVTISFAEDASIAPEKVMALLKRNRETITLIPEYTLRLSLPDESLQTASHAVKKCLQELL